MVEFQITYRGDLRCNAVHGPSKTELFTDAPVDNHGKGESFSPTDLLATALGTCMTTVMGIAAGKDGISLEGTHVRVEKHMTTSPPRKVEKLVVAFAMAPNIPPQIRPKLEHTARTCPVALSLHPGVAIDLSFDYPNG